MKMYLHLFSTVDLSGSIKLLPGMEPKSAVGAPPRAAGVIAATPAETADPDAAEPAVAAPVAVPVAAAAGAAPAPEGDPYAGMTFFEKKKAQAKEAVEKAKAQAQAKLEEAKAQAQAEIDKRKGGASAPPSPPGSPPGSRPPSPPPAPPEPTPTPNLGPQYKQKLEQNNAKKKNDTSKKRRADGPYCRYFLLGMDSGLLHSLHLGLSRPVCLRPAALLASFLFS